MGEAKEENEIGDQSNGYPRDLLQRLNHQERNVRETNHHTEEIELNLGLSLGGRFGVEPKGSKLVRSSSIAGLSTFLAEDDGAAPPLVGFPLVRTSSLPMESEEEMRRRKEIQSLRRLQAKRKRSEKKSIRLGKEKASVETNCRDKGVDGDGLIPNKAKVEGRLTGFRSKAVAVSPTPKIVQAPKNGVLPTTAVAPQTTAVAPPFGTPNWPRSSLQVSPKRKANAVAGQGFLRSSKQGSVASHGNSSSGDSKSETRSVQGLSNSNEVRSATSIPSSAEPNEQKPVITPELSEPRTSASVKVEVESPSKKPRVTDNLTREPSTKVMNDMPCVSTKGDGPNGRRIQGFLYNYKKGGEDVRIVCVCHGEFLTPAEFVKHGGGGDVAHPLKHIVVTPPTPLL